MARETLVSFLLRRYAELNLIKGHGGLAKLLGASHSTVWDWWNGVSIPSNRDQRAKLFRLVPHPVFQGEISREKRAIGLRPPTSQDRKFAFGSLTESEPNGEREQRTICLIRALLPDLKFLALLEDGKSRDNVRATLGKKDFNAFLLCVRILSSEQARDIHVNEGSLKDLGGES